MVDGGVLRELAAELTGVEGVSTDRLGFVDFTLVADRRPNDSCSQEYKMEPERSRRVHIDRQ